MRTSICILVLTVWVFDVILWKFVCRRAEACGGIYVSIYFILVFFVIVVVVNSQFVCRNCGHVDIWIDHGVISRKIHFLVGFFEHDDNLVILRRIYEKKLLKKSPALREKTIKIGQLIYHLIRRIPPNNEFFSNYAPGIDILLFLYLFCRVVSVAAELIWYCSFTAECRQL